MRIRLLLLAVTAPFASKSLRSIFSIAAPPPAEQGFRAAKGMSCRHAFHKSAYNDNYRATPSGKAHGFTPPSRPAKKKGHVRPSGRFY